MRSRETREERFTKGFEAMRKLEKNWDSYQGIPPSEKVIQRAHELALRLPDIVEISPMEEGVILHSDLGFEITVCYEEENEIVNACNVCGLATTRSCGICHICINE